VPLLASGLPIVVENIRDVGTVDSGTAVLHAELHVVRPMLAAAYGVESPQVRNLDKQIDRFSGQTRVVTKQR